MNTAGAIPMRFTLGKARLHGELCVPANAGGLVVFVHGSGSSRLSPRNQRVARAFNTRGLATLLFDLLTEHELPLDELTRQLRFDIPLLSQRLTGVIDQLRQDESLRALRIGLFGATPQCPLRNRLGVAQDGQISAELHWWIDDVEQPLLERRWPQQEDEAPAAPPPREGEVVA